VRTAWIVAAPTGPERALSAGLRAVERAFFRGEDNLADVVGEVHSLLESDVSTAGGDRARALLHLIDGDPSSTEAIRYRDTYGVGGVRCFEASTGDRIFQLRATTFPGHINYVYLVVGERPTGEPALVLWDVGSGLHKSRADILDCFATVRAAWHERGAAVESLTDIVISHAHIDHFGDAAYFADAAPLARLSVHELDARVLENFEERVTVASKDIGVFLLRAGVSDKRRDELEQMYRMSKSLFRGVKVDRRLRHGDLIAKRYEVLHTAGHCPGHLCMRVGEHMLVGDQVLAPITPHISPQSITPFTGLENYVSALLRLRMIEGVDLALPAHAWVMNDMGARIDEILAHHCARLDEVVEACRTPRTIVEVAEVLFGARDGYSELLSILEAGAHVEYLNELAHLRIANLDEVDSKRDPVLLYRAEPSG